jgi:hypothetical protein
MLSVQPGVRGRNDLRVGGKWRHFNCFFYQVTRGIPTGVDPENRVDAKEIDIENPGCPVRRSELEVRGE